VLNVIWLGWNKENNNFLAYYPDVGVLILEHEAIGEYPVDLNDSANEHVGNPKYHAISPDRQFRINGYYPGGAVDGMFYWLEKWNKSKKKYEFIGYFNDEYSIFDNSQDWFWTGNSKAIFRYLESFYEMELISRHSDRTNTITIDRSYFETVNYDVRQIDAERYYSSKEITNTQIVELEKITDGKHVKEMLKGVVIWDEADKHGNMMLRKIIFRNGKTYTATDGNELFFIAYYPMENILLLEGGHTADASFHLYSGEERDDVGNPEYFLFSPLGQYRLNGYFSGQDCSYYFIQENIDGIFVKIIQLNSPYRKTEFENKTGICLCRMIDAFWESGTVMNFVTAVPDEAGQQENKQYYQLILK